MANRNNSLSLDTTLHVQVGPLLNYVALGGIHVSSLLSFSCVSVQGECLMTPVHQLEESRHIL